MRGRNCWPTGIEPSLDELLSDPIVLALLRSDGLTRGCAEAAIAGARQALARAASRTARPAARRLDGNDGPAAAASPDLDAALAATGA